MRADGRNRDELRPVRLTAGFTDYAEGSVLVEFGKTRVLCNATIEDRLPRWLYIQNEKHGWVTAEYSLLPRSTQVRTQREVHGLGGRTQEIRRLIARSLRAAVDLQALGERQIIVDCDVLQADGGTRTAAITGGYVALALAIQKLADQGLVPAGTLVQPVAAVSAGVVNGEPLLDLCYEEDHLAEVDMNVVMDGSGRFIEVQGTAEGAPYARAALDRLLDLATVGVGELLALQAATLAEAAGRDAA